MVAARDYSRKRTTRIDKEIATWEKRKTLTLGTKDLQKNKNTLCVLDKIEDNITNLLLAKAARREQPRRQGI